MEWRDVSKEIYGIDGGHWSLGYILKRGYNRYLSGRSFRQSDAYVIIQYVSEIAVFAVNCRRSRHRLKAPLAILSYPFFLSYIHTQTNMDIAFFFTLILASIIMVALMAVGVALAMPFHGALVRLRANYNPRAVGLEGVENR